MNQIWIVIAQEGDGEGKIVMNIMTSHQRNEYINKAMSFGSKTKVVIQYQVGCTDLRVCNLVTSGVQNPNWFDKIMIGEDTYKANDKGSLEYIEEMGVGL